MKTINKIIRWKIIEITMMLVVIAVSYPLWKTLNIGEHLSTAAFYDQAQYTYLKVNHSPQGPMFPMDNEVAINTLNPMTISVVNESLTKENFNLIMKVSKTSTLDYNCLNVLFQAEVKSLKELYTYEDADHYYFLITSDSIVGETKDYNLLMWMDYRTGNEMQGKTLNYAFELQKGINI